MAQAAPWWWSLCGAQQTRYSRTRKAVGARVGGRLVRSCYSLGFHHPQGPPRLHRPQRLRPVGSGRETRAPGPPCARPPSYPNLPKPCLAHLTKGRAAKGCRLDQMAVFVDMHQVLAEGPAPGHMDYGHTVLQEKSRDQVRTWCSLHLPRPCEDGGSPRQSRRRTLQASSWSSTPSGCTQLPPGSQLP